MIVIFSTLYFEPEDFSMQDVAKKSGYGISTISIKARQPQQKGFLTYTKLVGKKSKYLHVERNILKILRNLFNEDNNKFQSFRLQLNILLNSNGKLGSCLPKEKEEIVRDLLDQLLLIEKSYNMIDKELKKGIKKIVK